MLADPDYLLGGAPEADQRLGAPALQQTTSRQSAQPSGRWPRTLTSRVLLRAVLCLPYLAIALWCAARGVHSPVNAALSHQGAAVRWGSAGLSWIANAYPPIPVAIASLIPGGATLLGVGGAVCAGGVLQLVWERLRAAALPWWTVALVLLALGGTPVFWFVATEDLSGFVGLALFAIALGGLLEFLLGGRTTGGFVAGIALALAVLSDPSALLYVASVFAAAPLLLRGRALHPGARRSAIAVIVFPALAAIAGWAFFEWRFTGAPFHVSAAAPGMLRFPGGVLAPLSSALERVGVVLGESPLFLLAGGLLVKRRPLAALAYLLVPLDLVAMLWLGLRTPISQGFVLMGLTAVLSLPRRPSRRVALAVALAAVVQIAVWTIVTIHAVALANWWQALVG